MPAGRRAIPRAARRPRERPFDIIDTIQAHMGGKLSLAGVRKFREGYKPTGVARKLFSRQGPYALDVTLDALHREGLYRNITTEDELIDAIDDAVTARKGRVGVRTAEEKEIARQETQRKDFETTALQGRRRVGEPRKTEPIKVNDLLEGDEFTIAGVKVKVKELVFDRDTNELAHVVLEDGRRFEVQTIGPDQILKVDEGTLKTTPPPPAPPQLRPMEKQGDLLSTQQEPFKLTGETATDVERIAAEKERIEKERADSEKQQRPLFGEGEGPGAAPRGFGPYPAIKQLQDQLKAAPKVGTRERIAWGERKADAWAQGKDLVSHATARIANVSQTIKEIGRGVRSVDDLQRRLGEYNFAIQQSAAMSDATGKAMEKQMHNEVDREAAAVLIDSARIAVDPRNPADVRQVIADGLAVMPSDTKPSVRRAFERALDPSLEIRQFAESLKQYNGLREQDAIDADLFEDGLRQYYTHIWKDERNMPGRLLTAFTSGKVSTYFQFARERKLSTILEGVLEGKTPVLDPAEVIPFYNYSMDRAIASRTLVKSFNDLAASDGRPLVEPSGIGLPSPDPPNAPILIKPKVKTADLADYEVVDHPAMRKWKWVSQGPDGTPIVMQGELLVHPEAYQRLRRMLDRSVLTPSQSMKTALRIGSEVKGLKFGLFSLFHQLHVGSHALWHWTNPFKTPPIDWEAPLTRYAIERGHLSLAPSPTELNIVSEGLTGGGALIHKVPLIGAWSRWYSQYLFSDYIPRLKLKTFDNALEWNRKHYAKDLASGKITQDELASRVGDSVNNAYGELNHMFLGKFGRDPRLQRLLRLIFLAPDFGEARLRFVEKAFTRYGGEERKAMATMAVSLYVAARVGNWLSHGDPEWDAKNLFRVKTGQHWWTMRSVVGDVAHLIDRPSQFMYVRMNPATSQNVSDLITARDPQTGKKLTFADTWDRIVQRVTPIQFSALNRDDLRLWESLISSAGVSAQRDTSEMEIRKAAADWRQQFGFEPPAEFVPTDTPSYQKLRQAIRIGALGHAERVLRDLRQKHSDKEIERAMSLYIDHPFTGSKEHEEIFIEGLTPKQRQMYIDARQEQMNDLRTYYELTWKLR